MKNTIANRLIGQVTDPFTFDKMHSGPHLNSLSPVTTEEVNKLIGSMSSKSSPMDFMPTSVLKKCSGVFAPLIARLANLSFAEGHFPRRFKQAQVIPLLKKVGMDVDDPANYRSISNLNTISKIIERLALVRLRHQITQSENLNQLQSAYRQHHSTETALLTDIINNYGQGL